MGILNYDTKKAPKELWIRRFLAFIMDAAVVTLLVYIVYIISGEPDFYRVKKAMEAYTATGNTGAALQQTVISSFSSCYAVSLLIWFCYETVMQILFNGATAGKLIMKLHLVPMNPERNKILQILLMTVRSGLKMLSLFFLQAFPFIICQLTIFTNIECRSGFDMAVKTKVVQTAKKGNA
jgi:uncharacterized RDD family membrane protein YckC